MAKRKKAKLKTKSAAQKNIDKINRNIESIAKVFGTNSIPYDIATQKLFLAGLKTYDKNGVTLIKNNKANRKKHQAIKKITEERKSVNIWKRKYGPPQDAWDPVPDSEPGPGPINEDEAAEDTDEPKETFLQWYSRISNDFFDLIDEVYACMDGCDYFDIPYNQYDLWNNDDYRMSRFEEIYEKLVWDTEKAREFYEKFGYGLAEDTGENITSVNSDNSRNNNLDDIINDVVNNDAADIDIDWD
ncbi:hypothetical protein [Ruminococcus sp.]|uniref:hypothetical protein n=1 Tax=Ruminococcus sp. TaxID=41978 RepID=UPI001B5E9FAA|nr:hypothetical protein [Ruminococcus sp.]MBP5431991.1 hypothetical protein [Ruminococcus sp.]